MAIPLIDNFNINTTKPIDSRMVVSNSTERINIQFKYDGLKVFQTDNRITYVWNDTTNTWSFDNSGLSKNGNENFLPIFGIDNSLQNSIIYNTRVISLSVPSGNPPKYRGKVAINNEDPKGTLHINSINDVSTSVPFIIDNTDSISFISRNFNNENNTVFKSSIGSINIKMESNSFEVAVRNSGQPNTSIFRRLFINDQSFDIFGRLNVDSTQFSLPSTINSNIIIGSRTYSGGSTNIISNSIYLVRDGSGTDWLSNKYHDAFSVDGVHMIPGNPQDQSPTGGTLTFIERYPNKRTIHLGSDDRYVFNVDATSNKRIGINTKTPQYTMDILGTNSNNGGPILSLKNEVSNVNTGGFGSGIILDNNKTSVNRFFIGTRQDNNMFNISNFDSVSYDPFLRISNTGDFYLDKLVVDNTTNLVLVKSSGNKISYRDVSSSFNLVTQSTNGLMSSVDKIKLDKFKFVGWVDIPAVNGTTPSVGSSYLFGGAITGAIRLNNTDTVVQITFPNMGTNNYYLKFTVESIGGSLGDIKSDNNVTHPVFRKVSQTQAVISIDKFDTVPNVRIIVEGHLF
jgi:hypothetical protein